MLNFYRPCLPSIAKTLKTLTDALIGNPKTLDCTPDCQNSIDSAKNKLANATPLVNPNPTAELALATDASDTHVGGVLQQRDPSGRFWQPLAFFSKKLEKTQTCYATFDRELLASFLAIRHFPIFARSQAMPSGQTTNPLSPPSQGPLRRFLSGSSATYHL